MAITTKQDIGTMQGAARRPSRERNLPGFMTLEDICLIDMEGKQLADLR